MKVLLIVLVLVLFNGFFALSEMAVITSRKGRLKEMAKDSRGARRALDLSEHPDFFLSSVQTWITVLGIITGYIGGESLGEPIGHWVAAHVPERLGVLRPERIAVVVAPPMHVFATIARPAVVMMNWSAGMFMKLMGLG